MRISQEPRGIEIINGPSAEGLDRLLLSPDYLKNWVCQLTVEDPDSPGRQIKLLLQADPFMADNVSFGEDWYFRGCLEFEGEFVGRCVCTPYNARLRRGRMVIKTVLGHHPETVSV